MDYVFNNIDNLVTPIGFFSLLNEDNNNMLFSVKNNEFNMPYSIYDTDLKTVIGTIEANTNYEIVIDAATLEIGKKYIIHFSGEYWSRCASDQNTVCYCTTKDNWVVGIGAYDPNDEEKDRQAYLYSQKKGLLKNKMIGYPDHFDESNFKEYLIERLPKRNGFRFTLLNDHSEKIYFPVAWVKADKNHIEDCKAAIGFWLT